MTRIFFLALIITTSSCKDGTEQNRLLEKENELLKRELQLIKSSTTNEDKNVLQDIDMLCVNPSQYSRSVLLRPLPSGKSIKGCGCFSSLIKSDFISGKYLFIKDPAGSFDDHYGYVNIDGEVKRLLLVCSSQDLHTMGQAEFEDIFAGEGVLIRIKYNLLETYDEAESYLYEARLLIFYRNKYQEIVHTYTICGC